MIARDGPLVTVLLATRNGAAFLGEQLASLAGQTHRNWQLRVSDDGSTDMTLATLETFQAKIGADRMTIGRGPGRGATANFLALLEQAGTSDGFVAFCDQDDVWLAEKLARAVGQIGVDERPVLYGCRVLIADAAAHVSRMSLLPARALGFQNALAENPMTGNSVVLNPAAAGVLRQALRQSPDRTKLESGFHDWWAYQVISAAGGRIVFDPTPGLLYRQHPGNLLGSGQAKGRFRGRVLRALGGEYGASLRRQAEAIISNPALNAGTRARVTALLALPDLAIWQRPAAIRRIGLYRQRRHEDLVLKILLLFGWV